MVSNYIVITDVDGTLLDTCTHSFEPALPAINNLKKRGIPVVLCSSKTTEELLHLRKKLDINDPFIVENGGGVYLPISSFPTKQRGWKEEKEHHVIETGVAYKIIRCALAEFRKSHSVNLVGFGDLEIEDIAEICGFSLEESVRAKNRRYDEPLLYTNISPPIFHTLKKFLHTKSLYITQGGRFLHVSGNHDKGTAIQKLLNIYHGRHKQLTTVGLGDSLNDISLLKTVDNPILVKKNDGSYDASIINEIPAIRKTPHAGPAGWNQALLDFLEEVTQGE